ncbi:MAG: anti-sigma factor antagonist [Acidobacteria bacterium CG_4_9_14_3_um_filter_49_7]|nr:MAG: anti-sigma factor antagonist [Acidobacteria bacterium CG_4_9_14_3_um_filter_49_7]
MRTEIRNQDNTTILGLHGKITIGEGDVLLRKNIKQQIESGRKNLILDMKDVKYMDSSGVGELVSSFTTVKNAGGKLKLANLNNRVHDLLQLTALITVFEVFDSVEDAANSF